MAEGAQQLFHVAPSQGEQLLELARVQIGNGAVALKLQMLFEQGAYRLGGLHLQIETCCRALCQRWRNGKAQGTGDQGGVFHA